MWILGISCFRDDATAALLHDGAIVGIAEEERFLRVKHSVHIPRGTFVTSLNENEPLSDFELRFFPNNAIEYLLTTAGIDYRDIDVVAYDFDFARRVAQWEHFHPVSDIDEPGRRAELSAAWSHVQRLLRDFAAQCSARLEFVPHHLAHAAGAVFGSGLADTHFCVLDGLGELESTTLGYFDGGFHVTHRVPLPHSLGLFYAAVTAFLGFRPFSDEQKTMGLASYGDPRKYASLFEEIVGWPEAGFTTDPGVVWTDDIKMDVSRPPALAGRLGLPGHPSAEQVCRDPYPHVAAAAQLRLEDTIVRLVDSLFRGHRGPRRLAMAGGVALNCKANGELQRRSGIDTLYVQPQAGDAGTALGAAYYAHYRASGSRPEALEHAYWGPEYSSSEVTALLDHRKLSYRRVSAPWETAADLLARGQIVGWFQGRAECGPRALGNRSILAHPGDPGTRDRINRVVKDRETWRPFAASILGERRTDYLAADTESPFMLLTIPLTERGLAELPAAAHVDGTTRPQTVSQQANPRYHSLIRAFEQRTGTGAVLNTSLNVKGEPIANSPAHALDTFHSTALDALVIGDHVLTKAPEAGGP
ncbi:carbamoyltransferase [Nocardiopsis mangrovi]|uniref:Carbamoyltransferase n=1 Tax=Nocardiopsis mangrovi TaxID=1179818 RepID=A0ABV9E0U8_9ACTN